MVDASEVFRNLFGVSSTAPSLFANNPYQRKGAEKGSPGVESAAGNGDEISRRKSTFIAQKEAGGKKRRRLPGLEGGQDGLANDEAGNGKGKSEKKSKKLKEGSGRVQDAKVDTGVNQSSAVKKGTKRKMDGSAEVGNVDRDKILARGGDKEGEVKLRKASSGKKTANDIKALSEASSGKTHVKAEEDEQAAQRVANGNAAAIKKEGKVKKGGETVETKDAGSEKPPSKESTKDRRERKMKKRKVEEASEASGEIGGKEGDQGLRADGDDTGLRAQYPEAEEETAEGVKGGGEGEGVEGKKSSQPERRTKEEEAERLTRTVFVGNLPKGVKKKAILREFTQFGEVESVRIRSVPLADTKLPRKAAVITGKLSEMRQSCNAYVVFKAGEGASSALTHNMAEFSGRHIRVDRAAAARQGPGEAPSEGGTPVEYDRTRSIFVGNLPFDVEEEEVHAVFGGHGVAEEMRGMVEAVRVVRDRHVNIGKGIAFVLFKTKVAARAARTAGEFKLRDRVLRISRPDAQKFPAKNTSVASRGFSSRAGHGSAPRGRMSGKISDQNSPKYFGTVLGGGGGGKETGPQKRGPAPWEGVRAVKVDRKLRKGGGEGLKPGKSLSASGVGGHGGGLMGTGGGVGGPVGKLDFGGERAKAKGGKRPAVVARKMAALAKKGSGGVGAMPNGGARGSHKGKKGKEKGSGKGGGAKGGRGGKGGGGGGKGRR